MQCGTKSNVFPVTLDARRLKIEIFLSWAYPELKNLKKSFFGFQNLDPL